MSNVHRHAICPSPRTIRKLARNINVASIEVKRELVTCQGPLTQKKETVHIGQLLPGNILSRLASPGRHPGSFSSPTCLGLDVSRNYPSGIPMMMFLESGEGRPTLNVWGGAPFHGMESCSKQIEKEPATRIPDHGHNVTSCPELLPP